MYNKSLVIDNSIQKVWYYKLSMYHKVTYLHGNKYIGKRIITYKSIGERSGRTGWGKWNHRKRDTQVFPGSRFFLGTETDLKCFDRPQVLLTGADSFYRQATKFQYYCHRRPKLALSISNKMEGRFKKKGMVYFYILTKLMKIIPFFFLSSVHMTTPSGDMMERSGTFNS